MTSTLQSLWIWIAATLLILAWLPFLAFIRFFDSDPVRYRTGRWFRRLGVALTKINPAWQLHISGNFLEDLRHPYVLVSNHQSLADIPLISHLPWEMKWIAKKELFQLPVVGWMMQMAGDIPVDRENRRQGVQALLQASRYLQQKCSVMVFPEGTRSQDGRVHEFTDGAFHLAIKAKVPVLPLAVEGSHNCLPKNNWRFGEANHVFLRVLPPVETKDMTSRDVSTLRDTVRQMIIRQVAQWRSTEPEAVDALWEDIKISRS